MLKFCTRALPLGHAFSRRLYASLNKVKKISPFLNNYNGCSYIQELNWISNSDLQLFTDNAGGNTWVVHHICMEHGTF